jgi:serine/threonine-protein kinase
MQAGDIIELELGSYVLVSPLGGSSYGVVWRAHGPHGAVALKLVNRHQMEAAGVAERPRWVDSARAEIAFLRGLSAWDARHIVRLLDTGEHDGLPVLALELMGADLARHLDTMRHAGRALPFSQVLAWMAQLNQALAKVHQYGWRYLDLKPGNVLVDAARARVKLADFGANRALRDTTPHSYAGTPNWQAPEQFFPSAQHSYDTDARTDYFPLGALFYFLVTGGVHLRYCAMCADAYRERGSAAPRILCERHGAGLPPILCDDEAALFIHRIDQRTAMGVPRRSAPATNAAGTALALLRQLLAGARAERPPHALSISRQLDAIRRSWQAQDAERRFFATLAGHAWSQLPGALP